MRQETEQSMLQALQNGQKYDESCKEVFKNREVIAPILKYAVREFRDCTREEIIRCIDADSIKEEVPVDDLPAQIDDRGTEITMQQGKYPPSWESLQKRRIMIK